jgi:hypothetical protein
MAEAMAEDMAEATATGTTPSTRTPETAATRSPLRSNPLRAGVETVATTVDVVVADAGTLATNVAEAEAGQ